MRIGILFFWLCGVWLARAQETPLRSDDSFYPRLIRLHANGAANGRLIASFDGIGVGHFFESRDDGLTWQPLASVPEAQYRHTCCSELYEVPYTLGNTTAGTLFWTVSAHNGKAPAARALKIYRSTDQGRTWQAFASPVTGTTGLWEAEFAIDAKGRLVMYYASEEHKAEGFNQLLAHKVSTDGGATWGEETIDVAIGGGVQRPGMPTVTRLPNDTYAMVYEICGSSHCDAFIRFSSDGTAWGEPSDPGTRIESGEGRYFAHAPTVTWMPDGSPNGLLVVVGQVLREVATGQDASDNGTAFFVNGTNGRGPWEERPTPMQTPNDGTHPCTNYSTQLLLRANGTELIQLANKNCRVYAQIGPLHVP
ncbi:BNR repeat-like domain-containing protein [Catalinimonas alkaloidigena]|uniref:BNR repeat-like domain-containing protein n=1 Tax=Catalinimonas alkaloidigena TaxID=1075417 RepID=A0A1G9A1P8_9BACT|nr:sialidase family protein [Catalinimonas alkaloidigena]SDK20784.1 BNR repeat-like domain-containing protein [Catalinimonas alkaloidigena]